MPSNRRFPLQTRGFPPSTYLLKKYQKISPIFRCKPPSAGRSLPAWRKLQGQLIPSLIFVFQTSCFSHLGQEKCETRQQSDQAGLWPRACWPKTLDLVVL